MSAPIDETLSDVATGGVAVTTAARPSRGPHDAPDHAPQPFEPPAFAIIDFALKWYRHGGGSAELIHDEFGLTPIRYFTILLWHLATDPPTPIRPDVIDAISSVARRRVWLATFDTLE